MESARPGVRWADIRDSEQLLTPDSSTEPQIMPIVIDDPATIVRSGDADIASCRFGRFERRKVPWFTT